MAFKFGEDGLKVEQLCKDPTQRGWADYFDNLAQDIRDGKVSINRLHHNSVNKTIVFHYIGETTK